MAKSNNAHVIGEGPESDHEVSGIRSSHFRLERQTAKVPRVDLERLLAQEREEAEVDEVDDTMMLPPSSRGEDYDHGPPSQDTTLRLKAPSLPPGLPSPLGSDFPPPISELTAVMKYTPVPIPAPSPPPFQAMRVARDDARRTKRIVVAIWAFAITLAGGLGYFAAVHG